MKSNGLYIFENSFGHDLYPVCKYDLLEKKIHFVYCIIYCTWMSIRYLYFTYYGSTLTSLTLIILYVKFCYFEKYFFQRKFLVKENT